MKNMIKITGVDLVKFVQKVYEFSKPQGMGMLHFRDGSLPEDDARGIVEYGKDKGIAISMDYVHGRACKMVVWREGDDLFVRPEWFDHSRSQLEKLLGEFGIALPEEKAA